MFRRGRRGRGGGVLRKAWWWGTSIYTGTWSDGKLTTRIGRNSGDVRAVLRTFVRHGAPAEILTQGAPHLGTGLPLGSNSQGPRPGRPIHLTHGALAGLLSTHGVTDDGELVFTAGQRVQRT